MSPRESKQFPGIRDGVVEPEPFSILIEGKERKQKTDVDDLVILHAFYRTKTNPVYILWTSKPYEEVDDEEEDDEEEEEEEEEYEEEEEEQDSPQRLKISGIVKAYPDPRNLKAPTVDFEFGIDVAEAHSRAVEKIGKFKFTTAEYRDLGPQSGLYNKGKCWIFSDDNIYAVPAKAVVVGVTEDDEVVETSYVKKLTEKEDDDFSFHLTTNFYLITYMQYPHIERDKKIVEEFYHRYGFKK